QKTQRVAETIAPAPVPQLDRDRITGKAPEQVRQVVLRFGCVLEAGWKLREQGAELACGCQRIDATPKLVEVRVVGPYELCERLGTEVLSDLRPDPLAEQPRVREFLIQLDGEFEIAGRPLGPSAADLGARLAVERRVDLNGVEVFGVKRELVKTLRPT